MLYQLSYIPAANRFSRTLLGLRLADDRAKDSGLQRNEYGRVAADPGNGGIAQLVEHYAGSVRVRSSSLLASTKERSFLRAFFALIDATVAISWPSLARSDAV